MKFDTLNTGCDVNQSYVEDQNNNKNIDNKSRMFVPFSEDLLAAAGSPLGELVPFQLEYQCVRLLDGTYEFSSLRQPLDSAAA